MKFLVTGANGFLGKHICQFFEEQHIDHRAVTRHGDKRQFSTGDLTQFSDWEHLFKEIDIVIHAAAKAHDMSKSTDLNRIYDTVNFELAVKLAEEAKKNKVKKFIFISTIKVNGERTFSTPFKAEDTPNPIDPYSISKYKAERSILLLNEPNQFEVTVIRPCLIYGSGVKANFNSLIKLVQKGLPLPFGLIKNQRSIVSVDNLIDLIMNCSKTSLSAGQIFLASDGVDLSIGQLINKIAFALNKKIILLPIPLNILNLCFALIGKKDLGQRLFDNLQVDINKNKSVLGWTPPYTTEQSLVKMLKGN